MRRSDQGQAVLEYILLLIIVVSTAIFINSKLTEMGLMSKLAQPLKTEFASTYRYGYPNAKGPEDDGGPDNHPRAPKDGNVRIFYVKQSSGK